MGCRALYGAAPSKICFPRLRSLEVKFCDMFWKVLSLAKTSFGKNCPSVNVFLFLIAFEKASGSEEKTESDVRWGSGVGHGWTYKRVVSSTDSTDFSHRLR